jgi:hypothetical protein
MSPTSRLHHPHRVRADPSTELRTGYAFGVSKPPFGGGVRQPACHPTPFGLSLSKALPRRSRCIAKRNTQAWEKHPCASMRSFSSTKSLPMADRASLRQAQAERGGMAREQRRACAKRGLRYAEGVPSPELRRRISPNGILWFATENIESTMGGTGHSEAPTTTCSDHSKVPRTAVGVRRDDVREEVAL